MIGLLARQLFRARGFTIGLLLLFATGLLSIYVGKVSVDRQAEIVALTDHAQQEHLERHVSYIDGHLGLLLYYVKFGFVDTQSSLSGLSIGQKDMRQAARLVNIRNLEEQKNAYELMNPYFQLLGNLDFSFLLIYFFPLIIIGLTFNLWSEEIESKRWPLIVVQSNRPKRLLVSKLLLRLGVVLATFLSLLLIAVLYLRIAVDTSLLLFAGVGVLYLCFWFALCWWVIGYGRSSRQNAMLLLTAWILLTTLLPAATNSLVTSLYPIPEAYETTIDSRDGYHNKWDEAKAPTIAKFKSIYPQYEKYEHPADASFSWFWYYAMQHLGDAESQAARQAMKAKLHQRNDLTRWIGRFVPSIHTQLSLNAVSQTDMTNYLHYLDALETFHEDLRLTFYPEIFEATPIPKIDWSDYPLVHREADSGVGVFVLLPLLLANLLLWILGSLVHRRH